MKQIGYSDHIKAEIPYWNPRDSGQEENNNYNININSNNKNNNIPKYKKWNIQVIESRESEIYVHGDNYSIANLTGNKP